MPKYIHFPIILLIMLNLPFMPNAYATEQNSPLIVSVTVETIFRLEVDQNSIDFGSVEPGATTPQKGAQISCSSNANVPWKLSVHAQTPFTYQEYEIPNSNFIWYATSVNTNGQLLAGSGAMSLAPVDFYTAASSEYITESPVEVLLATNVNVPLGQVAGRYESVIVVTMQPEQ